MFNVHSAHHQILKSYEDSRCISSDKGSWVQTHSFASVFGDEAFCFTGEVVKKGTRFTGQDRVLKKHQQSLLKKSGWVPQYHTPCNCSYLTPKPKRNLARDPNCACLHANIPYLHILKVRCCSALILGPDKSVNNGFTRCLVRNPLPIPVWLWGLHLKKYKEDHCSLPKETAKLTK